MAIHSVTIQSCNIAECGSSQFWPSQPAHSRVTGSLSQVPFFLKPCPIGLTQMCVRQRGVGGRERKREKKHWILDRWFLYNSCEDWSSGVRDVKTNIPKSYMCALYILFYCYHYSITITIAITLYSLKLLLLYYILLAGRPGFATKPCDGA